MLPQSRRMRRLVIAMIVDSFGSGLFGPFALLYATVVVGVSLPAAGAALGAASIAALGVGLMAGVLVDRFGAARIAVTGNLLAALGGAVLLVARNLPVFVLGSFLSAVAIRVFWSAFAPLVGEVAGPADRERWFGLVRGSRYAGMAAGGLLASVVLLLGQRTGLLVMAVVDAASYLVAGLLIATAGVTTSRAAVVADTAPTYRLALRDRDNVVLALLNVPATLLITAPTLAMPVYVLTVLDQPAWVPGVLAGSGTAAVAIGLTFVHRVTAGRRRLMVLATASLVWTVGALAYASASATTAGLTVAVLLVAVLAIAAGEALHGPTADTLPLTIAPPGLAGRYTAVHQLAWGISGAIAPALVGALLGHSATVLWLVLAVIAATTAVTYVLLPARAHDRSMRVGSAPDGSRPVLDSQPVPLPQ